MEHNEHIQKFLNGWKRERDHYGKLAEKAKEICEKELKNSAIQAQVTFRAKELSSLRNKLMQRNSAIPGGYKSVSQIRKDIVDLAGVRIALYFPNHRLVAEKIIFEQFKVHKKVDHNGDTRTAEAEVDSPEKEEDNDGERRTYVAHFSGYRGKHYRVSNLDDGYLESDPDLIEIQVISMLHHTWAQVGHDLVYKQMSGLPSVEEERILDGLSGLIRVGEVLLEQLHDVHQARSKSQNIRFANHYELGSFLSTRKLPPELSMGSLDLLHTFLGIVGYNNPRNLMAVIGDLEGPGWYANNALMRETEDTTSLKPSISAILIDSILSRINHEGLSQRKFNETGNSGAYRLRVMSSTIVLLNELFPPFDKWVRKLFVEVSKNNTPKQECVAWLKGTARFKGVYEGEQEISEFEEEDLLAPWDWFRSQPNYVINLAFRVAEVGLFSSFLAFSSPRNILALQAPVTSDEVPDYRVTRGPWRTHIVRPNELSQLNGDFSGRLQLDIFEPSHGLNLNKRR